MRRQHRLVPIRHHAWNSLCLHCHYLNGNISHVCTSNDEADKLEEWPPVPPDVNKVCQTVACAEMAEFGVKDGIGCQGSLNTTKSMNNIAAYCSWADFCAGGSSDKSCLWRIQAPACVAVTTTPPESTETPVSTTASPTTTSPTTASPTTTEPTTAEPTTASPTTVSPTTASPTTVSPTIAEPSTVTPTTTSPTTAEPTTAESTLTTASPTTVSPTTAEPTTASPTTAEPTTTTEPMATASPTTVSPTTAEPTTASPTTAEPTTESTEATEPGAACEPECSACNGQPDQCGMDASCVYIPGLGQCTEAGLCGPDCSACDARPVLCSVNELCVYVPAADLCAEPGTCAADCSSCESPPDCSQVGAGGGDVCIWDEENGQCVSELEEDTDLEVIIESRLSSSSSSSSVDDDLSSSASSSSSSSSSEDNQMSAPYWKPLAAKYLGEIEDEQQEKPAAVREIEYSLSRKTWINIWAMLSVLTCAMLMPFVCYLSKRKLRALVLD